MYNDEQQAKRTLMVARIIYFYIYFLFLNLVKRKGKHLLKRFQLIRERDKRINNDINEMMGIIIGAVIEILVTKKRMKKVN